MMSDVSAQEVLDFWFSPEVEPNHFSKDDAFDQLIRDRFGPTHAAAIEGALESWRENAAGSLALVIVLDQFPRNMFRDDARAFASDEQARQVASAVIDQGQDQQLSPGERVFLYMPFMHGESLEVQDRSVALYQALGIENNLNYAEAHRDVISQFGRFPHRNAILGRSSTPEEEAYLAQPGAGF